MIHFFSTINPTSSGLVNTVIQMLLMELSIFLAVPVVGFIVESVIVKGLRGALARLMGRRLEYFFTNYVLFVGVIIHELSHAFFAMITGAKIVEIALFKPEGGSLGHVTYQTRGNTFAQALQNSFAACAPVVVGLTICGLMITKVFPVLSVAWQWIVMIYLFVSVAFHMNMSKPDIKAYFSGTLPLLVVMLPVTYILVLVL